jgi:alkylated DNA nucleotide flippase Atl1
VDYSTIEQAALALWPLVGTGAAQRAGEAGMDQALRQADSLWHRVRSSRARRGLQEKPASIEELRADLEQILSEDPKAGTQIQMVVNHFHGPNTFSNSTIGIVNK